MRILLLFVLVFFAAIPSQSFAGPVFDRVMKDRVLRCAYTIYPPFFAKDPNTGKFSGLFHDITEELAKELSIKVEWTEEVGSDGLFQGFASNRYDAVCVGYFTTPSRANGGDFTKPPIYAPYYVYVRADENRFKTLDDLNAAGVKMGTMDGEFSDVLRNQRFSKTESVSLTGLSSAAERFELIATGKADFTAAEAALGLDYMAHNPGKLKAFGAPVSMGPSVILVPQNEYPLVAFLNAGIDGLIFSGKLKLIRDKYQEHEGAFLLPADPYETPK